MSVDLAVFAAVVAARLLLPLLIFRYPLVGIVICLVLDGIDQTVFQTFTDLDLTNYQSYDKALDVYYLALAYIATMRNWVSWQAFLVAAALFYYRLVGVVAFELTGAEHRSLLLLFPNTFEYFFIFYELVRTRWDPRTLSLRFWVYAAAVIWVGIKLPQEYWIHIAKLDVTDAISAHPGWAVVVALLLAGALYIGYLVARTRVRPPDHPLQLAAGPLPVGMDELEDRLSARLRHGRVFDLELLERIALVSLVSTIFVQIIPGIDASVVQIAVSTTILVVVNSVLYLFTARRGWGIDSAFWSFLALAAFNLGFVTVIEWVEGSERDFDLVIAVFFVGLLTLIVSTYGRYRPVLTARMAEQAAEPSRP